MIYPVHDFGFKALMGHKMDCDNSLIKDFLKSMFHEEFEIIEFKDREMTPAHLLGKTICLDLRVKCEGVIFNLEMQMFPTRSEAERALYYACGAICDQNLKGKSYKELEAVHQVFLLARNANEFQHAQEHYQLFDIENGQTLTDKMKISMISLERIVEEIHDLKQMDDLQKWCLFFLRGHLFHHEGIQLLMKEERFRKAERIMRDVNQDEMFKDAAFQRMKDEIDHFTRLSNARKEGRKEGIDFAEAKHQKENEVRIIHMIQDGLNEALIMKYCNITKEELEEYRRKL